ncbi:hypothetical protein GCM10018785_45320 [Streptomyces longispororuber]|uniref:Uncharacterized protein n=1 Tax=Streptomyces longispororuber TaxID=68230 RepID=A0A918ZW68_9ACTN|nr:hypothetical protein GCM10018785_45320 [Streptomyces longispororuber]
MTQVSVSTWGNRGLMTQIGPLFRRARDRSRMRIIVSGRGVTLIGEVAQIRGRARDSGPDRQRDTPT